MKIFFAAVVFLLSASAFCHSQEDGVDSKESLKGFAWLKQFEGTWDIVSDNDQTVEGDEHAGNSTMTSRLIGRQFVVCEQAGKVGGTRYEALQTVGYDSEKEEYVGTWVDSTSNYTWNLRGKVDKTGKKLTLGSEGRDWNDPSKMRKYRDVYEFKSADEIASMSQMMNDEGKWQTFMSSTFKRKKAAKASVATKPSLTPFLMFTGQAEEAIEFYKTVFSDLKVSNMVLYEAGETGKEGTVKLGEFEVAGQKVRCTDSPPVHDFTFTPSFSFFVECENAEALKEKFKKLSDGGKVMMPVNDYGFSEQFGWCSDKFGVSWQLNLNMRK